MTVVETSNTERVTKIFEAFGRGDVAYILDQLTEEPAPYRERARTRLEQACGDRLTRVTDRASRFLRGQD